MSGAIPLEHFLLLSAVLFGIGLGFDISRRNGGHRPDGASGDGALESKAS